MTSYEPSEAVVREHIEHVRATAHEPPWRQSQRSLELLLGLRRPEIDRELLAIAPRLSSSDDNLHLDAEFVRAAVSDYSACRILTVVARTQSPLVLAWFEPLQDEASHVAADLAMFMAERSATFGVPSTLFVSVCDLTLRAQVDVPEALKAIAPDRWLERTALDAATTPERNLTFYRRDHGLPEYPAALIRDPLTGLLSRGVLTEDPHRFTLPGAKQITRLPKAGVVLADVDRMQHIAAHWGLQTGDHILRGISDALQRRFGDNVIRFGGDEFLLLCDANDVRSAASAAVHLVRDLRLQSFEAPHEAVPVTISVGAAAGPGGLETLRAADDALGKAKEGGRDRFVVA